MIVDVPFLAASLALGWGLSLATYRVFAIRNDWPMGEPQAEYPIVPVLIGMLAVVIGGGFALLRGAEYGGFWILLAGLLWAFFWTGFLRVASQTALFLAPVASIILVLGVLGIDEASDVFPSLKRSAAAVPLPERATRWHDVERRPLTNPQ